jgi:hypothetical protein
VAFGAFVGAAANTCARAALVCDDTIPATLDGCAPASGCTHAIRGEAEVAEAGIAALEREIAVAVDGGGVAPAVLDKLQPLLDSVRDLLAPTTTPEGRNLKKRLKRADRQLRRIQRLLKRALRDGTIDREVGLRLLDLLRSTRESIRRTLRASRTGRNPQVRPSIASGSRTFGGHSVGRPLPPLSD